MDYVLAGNGPAAVSCARAIRGRDKQGRVFILSPETRRPYSRISVPEYLTGEVKEEDLYFRTEDFYRENGIEPLYGEKLEALEPEDHIAVLSGGRRLPYHKLLLATGSRPLFPSWLDVSSGGVYSLWDKKDAEILAGKAMPGEKAVIIGGGLVGLQAARALHDHGLEITVVEAADRLMPQQLDYAASSMLREATEKVGLAVRAGVFVEKLRQTGGAVCGVLLKNGEELAASLVLAAIGVRPNLSMLESSGADYRQGLEVDEYMYTGLPDIYAAGDVVKGPVFPAGNKEVRATWMNAVEQGRIAGINMAGGRTSYEGSRVVNSIRLFGLSIASAGKIFPGEGQRELVFSPASSGSYGKLVMAGEMLLGVLLAGDIQRAGPLFQKIGGPLTGFLGPGPAFEEDMAAYLYSRV
jgi:NAD(P)H-nitrite reductase large subunit